jgi:hypothetical protein
MKIIFRAFVVLLLSVFASVSYAWDEPARGSADRSALMDAIRPHIEWDLGAPIEFVIVQLRVSENVAYASVGPQRPGGGIIDPYSTPGYSRGDLYPDAMDGTSVSVLYRKLRNTWVAVHFSIGATDVWFASPEYCNEYGAVIIEFCS